MSRPPLPALAAPTGRPRRAGAALGIVALLAAAAACSPASAGTTTDESGTTVLRYQGSVGQVGFPELAEDLGYFEDVKLEWIGDVTGGPRVHPGDRDRRDRLRRRVQRRDRQAPVVGRQDHVGHRLLRVRRQDVRRLLRAGGQPRSRARRPHRQEDRHQHPRRAVRVRHPRVAHPRGPDADEIKQVELTVVPPVNAEQVLREGQVDVVRAQLRPEGRRRGRGGLRPLFSEKDLFGEFTYGSLVFRDDFIEENPEAVKDFVQGVARAIRWAQVTPVEEVRARYTKIITEPRPRRDHRPDPVLEVRGHRRRRAA